MAKIRQSAYVIPWGEDNGTTIFFLNQKDPWTPNVDDEGKIALLGGGVEPGEGYEEAAVRELSEETGDWWSNRRKGFLSLLAKYEGSNYVVYVYTLEVDASQDSYREYVSKCREGTPLAVTHFRLNDLNDSYFGPGIYEAVKRAKKKHHYEVEM